MQRLTVSIESAPAILLGLVQQGLTFEAVETDEGTIEIKFLGGF